MYKKEEEHGSAILFWAFSCVLRFLYMNDSHTSFLKTRKFWLVTYSFLFVLSVIFFALLVNSPYTIEGMYFSALFSLGAGLLILAGASLAAQAGAFLASLLFLALYVFVVYGLIRHKHVPQLMFWLLLLIIVKKNVHQILIYIMNF